MSAKQTTNIKVAVRVRPYNRRELEQNQRCIVKVIDNTTLLFDPDKEDDEFFFQGIKQTHRDITKRAHKKLNMEFDHVFDTNSHNKDIFQQCTAPLVEAVLNGYNCSVFVYGATGAGKTFTMLGNETCPGLTFLTMRDLFEKMEAQRDTRKFNVGVSYLEVYNEQVMNLLTKSGPLKLREDSNGVVVSGLVLKPIHNAEELLDLLTLGNSNRTQHPTDANAESSRSHAIFQVHIWMTECNTGIKRVVKLSLIDLAGSERAASTKGIGLRFKEGASINKSLLALGNCINKLADGLKHIPFRDSNLTRILKDSLDGNCRTLMVANVSMSSLTYEDTYNTLKYASRAQKIRTTLRQNALTVNISKEFYIKKVTDLTAEIERLTGTNKELEAKVSQFEMSSNVPETHSYDECELKHWYTKMDAMYSIVINTQECVIGLQSKIKNLDFRLKLKDYAETYGKLLSWNPNFTQEKPASLSHMKTQMESHKMELTRWRKKLQDVCKDLQKLKKEVKNSKHADVLQIYERSKDQEVLASKQNINIKHISRINSALICNSHKSRQAITIACKVLQKLYTTQTADQHLEKDVDNNLEQLHSLLTTSHIPLNENSHGNSDEDLDFGDVELLENGKYLTTNNAANSNATKKLKFDTNLDLVLESADESVYDHSAYKAAKFNAYPNLNETHVLSVTGEEHNSTFDAGSGVSVKTQTVGTAGDFKKKYLVNNILSEHIARVKSNKNQLKNALLKSNNFNHQGLKTLAVGVQRENKMLTTGCVRKSPRAPAKAIVTAVSSVRKQTTRMTHQINSTSSTSNSCGAKPEPIVRINRAAYFRVKK